MTAYDYTNQRWLTGEEARAERKSQIESDLALLKSDKGQAYADLIGANRIGMISRLTQELANL